MKFTPIVMDDICKHMSKEQPDKWFVFVTLNPCSGNFEEGRRLCEKMGIEMDDAIGFHHNGSYEWAFSPVWYMATFNDDETSSQYIKNEWWNEKPVAFAALWHNGEVYGDNT